MKRYLFIPALFLIFATVEAQEPYTISVATQLVIIDTTVKDKDGKVISDLKKGDFTVSEDGKTQQIAIFEFQKLDEPAAPVPVAEEKEPATPAAPKPAPKPAEVTAAITTTPGTVKPVIKYQDKRLVVMYFDFSSMPVEDQARVQTNALKFVKENLLPSDLVAIMTVSTGPIKIVQDFTNDKEALEASIKKFSIGEGAELADTLGAGDTSDDNTFSADQSEFDIANTDRKFLSLETAAKMLAAYPEKKAMFFFTSGITQNGTNNQAQLQKTINTAKKSNVVINAIDARGMTASAPGGSASQASSGGAGLFTAGGASGGGGGRGGGGGGRGGGGGANDTALETLSTLSNDTGGKLFAEDNNLSVGMAAARDSISSYYVIGYYSTNGAMDGKYRTVEVKMNNSDLRSRAKLEYRHGYFGDKTFKKFTSSDKDNQLAQALMLGDPITDLDLKGEINYFRLARDRYFVPFFAKVPGSEIALSKSKGNTTAVVDFIGQILDSKGNIYQQVSDTYKIPMNASTISELSSRPVAYNTGFTVPPGKWKLRFLARENETGKMGTFEGNVTIPDLGPDLPATLKTSTIVWSSQLQTPSAVLATSATNAADRRTREASPLVQDGQEMVPSITRVFRKDQNLYVYMEVYDPTQDATQKPSVAATLSFFRGRTKMAESQPVRMDSFIPQRGQTLPVRFMTPLANLPTGRYTAQINLIDENGKKFGFQRADIIILPRAGAAAPAAPAGPGGSL